VEDGSTYYKVFFRVLNWLWPLNFFQKQTLVTQSHLLEKKSLLFIWIAIFLVLYISLRKKLNFHDSDNTRISVGRLLTGLVVLTFYVYLIPGMWGAKK
jgi:thiol:disulfide interchange protein DsbD